MSVCTISEQVSLSLRAIYRRETHSVAINIIDITYINSGNDNRIKRLYNFKEDWNVKFIYNNCVRIELNNDAYIFNNVINCKEFRLELEI